MVEQVLAVSRAESATALNLVELDPAALVRQVLADLAPLFAREGAQVTAELPAGERVRADEPALTTALRNLLLNAVHYSPAPARVTLSLGREGRGGRWLRLAVRDEGPGIPRREQKRVFQSFYRVGEAGRRPTGIHGSGLGLYLVKRNLEAMGGRVELVSSPGAGATFSLLLPALPRREGD
jgi:two-component system sensor histidine kinase SenX3